MHSRIRTEGKALLLEKTTRATLLTLPLEQLMVPGQSVLAVKSYLKHFVRVVFWSQQRYCYYLERLTTIVFFSLLFFYSEMSKCISLKNTVTSCAICNTVTVLRSRTSQQRPVQVEFVYVKSRRNTNIDLLQKTK
jgi:hypothetical protein